MSPEDVKRLAAAIAKANGHTEADDWATSVVAAWETLEPAAAEPVASTETQEGA